MIRKGDIVFVMHHGSWVSRAFGWFMDSRWSHCAMVADVGDIDTYLHETSDTQTKVGMLSLYELEPKDEIEIVRVNMGGRLSREIASRHAAKYHNEMYGYIRLVGAGIRRLMMKLGWKKCPMLWPWGGPLCMMIPHRGLLSTFAGMPKLGSIDTEELYRWCLDNGKVIAYKRVGFVGLEKNEVTK